MPILSTELPNAASTASSSSRNEELIVWLQRHNNPFDDYVHPNRVSKPLRAIHVDKVNQDVTTVLRKAVQQYRLDWHDVILGREQDVLWSGVIVVFGKRGAGKTHLLHHEMPTDDGVIVTATEFETHRPFREFLLVELVERLRQDPPHRSALVDLAQWFTRKLLAHAVRSLSEIEWLCLCEGVENQGLWSRLLTRLSDFINGHSKRFEHQRDELIEALEREDVRPMRELCEETEQSADFLRRLALAHVCRTHPARTAAHQLRRKVYGELVEMAFSPDRTEIFDALLSGADANEGNDVTVVPRSTLVDERLSCLVELFMLHGRPIVFAFDALELLLGDPPDKVRCQAFHNGIAQVVDVMPGVPFFVLAEEGHWNHASQHFSDYAEQRFQRGIPVPGRGAVNRLDLAPIDSEGLKTIVAARLRPLLVGAPISDQLNGNAVFPFRMEELDELLNSSGNGGEPPSLRVILRMLQQRYDEIVFKRRPRGESTPEVNGEIQRTDSLIADELNALWELEVRKAERLIENGSLSSLSDKLNQGLLAWLQYVAEEGETQDGWMAQDVEIVTFGNDLQYGHCLRCIWKKGNKQHLQGLAFLLGARKWMPRDLETKVKMIQSANRVVDSLRLLWPRAEEIDPTHEALPNATAEVWNDLASSKSSGRVRLKSIDVVKLAPWLALPPLRHIAIDEKEFSEEIFQHFVSDKMSSYRFHFLPFGAEGQS